MLFHGKHAKKADTRGNSANVSGSQNLAAVRRPLFDVACPRSSFEPLLYCKTRNGTCKRCVIIEALVIRSQIGVPTPIALRACELPICSKLSRQLCLGTTLGLRL